MRFFSVSDVKESLLTKVMQISHESILILKCPLKVVFSVSKLSHQAVRQHLLHGSSYMDRSSCSAPMPCNRRSQPAAAVVTACPLLLLLLLLLQEYVSKPLNGIPSMPLPSRWCVCLSVSASHWPAGCVLLLTKPLDPRRSLRAVAKRQGSVEGRENSPA